ncbi:DUF1254 domain-containing protein [Falsiroseomonas sp. E2-1-a20]|uniref:DUF1254 domain-containing protein n=1 Tax=Falsiroseomonas sp. E2-1-a20 TaxID=3239300 RepID=UPI003F3E5FA6
METITTRRDILLGGCAMMGGIATHSAPGVAQPLPDPAEIRAIAKEAFIYGYPLVDSYRIQHAYFVDHANPEFKAPYNTLTNIARVFTPEDRAVQTPNSDTPYSFIGLDLRAEPLILTVPAVAGNRYYSIQLIDSYTFNFDYIGSRTAGNGGGQFLIAGPNWRGEIPPGIARAIRSETELAFGLYRTQLLAPDDIEEVRAIQAGYRVQPLSSFLGQTPAPAAPAIDFVPPLGQAQQRNSLDVFRVLNFVLRFCPTHPSEVALMQRLARIGIGAAMHFDPAALDARSRLAFERGIADAWQDFNSIKQRMDRGEVTSGQAFGTRDFLRNDYLLRMLAAVVGIYGNSREEAIYPLFVVDSDGAPLNGGSRYTLRFAADALPPVNAFWSVTMYRLPESLLVANPLNRYLLNSSMLSGFVRDFDEGITFDIQAGEPNPGREPNWLPAPNGSFMLVMRLYWPKPLAFDDGWRVPRLQKGLQR